jgi:hypothetical protein
MAVLYDPPSGEWNALFVDLVFAFFAGFSFLYVAASFHWKHWYSRQDVPKPWLFWPEVYGTFRIIAILLVAFGMYCLQREMIRFELGTLPTDILVAPSNTYVMAANILYLVFVVFAACK